jgi:hypothetical protein
MYSVFSVITGTEPKEPKPNLLSSMFSEEPIGPYFSDNLISVKTAEPNRSVSVNRMPKLTAEVTPGVPPARNKGVQGRTLRECSRGCWESRRGRPEGSTAVGRARVTAGSVQPSGLAV